MADTLLAAPVVQSLGWALVHFLWQGTVIAGATAGALRGLGGARSTTRYAVACAGLAMMLMAPAVTFVSLNADEATPSGVIVARPVVVPVRDGASTSLDLGRTPALDVKSLLPATVMVWIAGVLLLSARLVVSSFGVGRLKRESTRDVDERVAALLSTLAHRLRLDRSVRVLESAVVRVPTVVGCLRPVILLPASVISGLPVTHLEAVITHELAHIRRHDYIVNAGQAIVETLLFYHPAAWWCSRQIRIEREHCCDDIVVQTCGDRLAYIAALADLEDLRLVHPTLALRASGGRLIDRVRRMLATSPDDSRRSAAWVFVSTLAVALVLVVSASTLSHTDAAQAATPAQSVEPTPRIRAGLPVALREPRAPRQRAVPAPPAAPAPPVPTAAVAPPALPTPPASPAPPAPPAPATALAPEVPARPGVAELDALPAPPTALAPQVPAPPAFPLIAAPPAPLAMPARPVAAVAPAAPAPPPPVALPVAPASQLPPALPASPATPAPPGPAVLPVRASPAALPSPPPPPRGDQDKVGAAQPIAARAELAFSQQELARAVQELTRQLEALRRLPEQIDRQRAALRQAETEAARLRAANPGQDEQVMKLRNALEDLYRRNEDLRASQPDLSKLREQLEALRKQFEAVGGR